MIDFREKQARKQVPVYWVPIPFGEGWMVVNSATGVPVPGRAYYKWQSSAYRRANALNKSQVVPEWPAPLQEGK